MVGGRLYLSFSGVRIDLHLSVLREIPGGLSR